MESVNPYASPREMPPWELAGIAEVDRDSRNQMAMAIRQYLDEKITAFEFDERIMNIRAKSKDPTVARVAFLLWFFYDDVKDHKVRLNRDGWNYFQRLLLLLESDAKWSRTRRRQWSFRQLAAAISLLAIGCCAVYLGWGEQLFALLIPAGIASIMLSFWKVGPVEPAYLGALDTTPFADLTELEAAYRQAGNFRKRRYPDHLMKKEKRESAFKWFEPVGTFVYHFMLSPFLLVWMVFPVVHEQVQVDS